VLLEAEVGALEVVDAPVVVPAVVVVGAAVVLEVVVWDAVLVRVEVGAAVVEVVVGAAVVVEVVVSGAVLVVSRAAVAADAFCRYSYVSPLLTPTIKSDVRSTVVPGGAATTSLTMTPSASLTSPRMLPNHEWPKSADCSGRISTALGEGG
jgi:hypothetical protein